MAEEKKSGGGMTVREAGRKGGQKVRDERGHAFYEEIGHKGGQKVKELIEAGKRRAAEAAKNTEKKGE
jgi:general stress protein YciG